MTASARSAFLGLLLILGAALSCSHDIQVLEEKKSSNGEFVATTYASSAGGALGDDWIVVNVRPKDVPFRPNTGDVLQLEHSAVEVEWVGDHLNIRYSSDAVVHKRLETWRRITISYSVIPRKGIK
jgi:hypothetical protein